MNFHKICVLGLGYIGLPTASTFATYGLQVVGVDVNEQIVHGLQNGQLHLYEPGLRTLVQAALKSGNLIIQQQPVTADAFIIAVPTPITKEKKADMKYVISAAESILPVLNRGNLVVLESTSPPRTTLDLVAPILERSGLKAGQDFSLVYSPERVLPGQILRELIENTRVIGGINETSAQCGRDLYATFVRGEIILTDATTAEMVKLIENTYRDVNIALANEFSHVAERFGVDAWEVIRLANLHPRVNILNPGPGVGGHCISVDPWFLVETPPDETSLIRTARLVNDAQPQYVVKLIHQYLGELRDKKIALLGLTYKANVDDLRESPALVVANLLLKQGAQVAVFDPFIKNDQHFKFHIAPSWSEAIQECEAILLLVAHDELLKLEPQQVYEHTKARVVVDTVNGWDRKTWQAAGFQFLRLGDGKV